MHLTGVMDANSISRIVM